MKKLKFTVTTSWYGFNSLCKLYLFPPLLQYYEMSYGLNVEMHKQVNDFIFRHS